MVRIYLNTGIQNERWMNRHYTERICSTKIAKLRKTQRKAEDLKARKYDHAENSKKDEKVVQDKILQPA